MNPTNFKYGIRLPQATEDNTKLKLVAIDDDGNIQAYITKIPASMLPPIAITSVILSTETSISDFATNSGSYTFEQGDVIILDNGNGSYYMYNGGTKTNVSSYNEITTSEVEWSQIVNTPISLSGYGITDAYTKTESNTRYANLTGDTFTGPVISPSFSGDGSNITNVDAATLDGKLLSTSGSANTIPFIDASANLYVEDGVFTKESGSWMKVYSSSNFVAGTNYLAPNGNGIGLTNVEAASLKNEGLTFATLPSSPNNGDIATITDASNVVSGGNAAGGGTDTALVVYDGANWVYSGGGGLPVDFYDEGTFTPDLIDNGGGATYSFTISTADYKRVGNLVYITVELASISTSGTPSVNTLNLTNLPFTSISKSSLSITRFVGSDEVLAINVKPELTTSTNKILFKTSDNNGAITAPTFTSGYIVLSGTYETNVYTP